MIRLIMFLLGKQYESCKSCQTLKDQLEFEREEKRVLTETLVNIVNPKQTFIQDTEFKPTNVTAGLFSRRRAEAERRDRESAKILKSSTNLVRDDKVIATIEQLEEELQVKEN